jgi:hypothetical protein
MRWLETSCLSMVLALGLALSVNAQSGNPSQPNQSTNTEPHAQQHDAVASPTASALNQSAAVVTASTGATYIYNYYKQSSPCGDLPSWLEAIATILLVAVAGWQMGFIRRSTAATEEASKAARDNAFAAKESAKATEEYVKISERALVDVQRPWVLVFEVKWPSGVFPMPAELDATPRVVTMRISYKNFGPTPAWITDSFILMIKTENMDYLPTEPLYLWGGLENEIPVAPNGATPEIGIALAPKMMLTPEEIRQIERRESFIYAYGIVKYRDVHNREHETRWGSIYFVPRGFDQVRGFRMAGPKAYNRHT